MSLLAHLNDQQREAVLHEQGPLLVLAGAGSGKTRVITYRVAHLIMERDVDPYNILAVTFTNKAAGEMKDRVRDLVGSGSDMPIISTFHSFCLRVLRVHIGLLGYPSSFSIYDVNDQLALIRRLFKKLNFSESTPKAIQSRISFAKNSKYGVEKMFSREIDEPVLQLYHEYQKEMKSAGAVDFDDILLLTNELFSSHPHVLERYQKRFHYLMVDEYQDTNTIQYNLIKAMAAPQNNICAVGDDDQSIYKWRGADISNILNFSKDFPGTLVIKLEQNYRSTQNILDAAHGMVEYLPGRHPKKLWTDKGRGEKITWYLGDDETSEASFVVRTINNMKHGNSLSDFAILYRTNAQSRVFEEILGRHKIPYQLIGGTRFYDRKEIKDVLAYLQFALNPADIVSFRRIINTPTRGIGDVSVGKVEYQAAKSGCTAWDVLKEQVKFLDVPARTKSKLTLFKEMISVIREHVEHGDPPSEVIDFILKESEYLGSLIKEGTDESFGRIENIKELIASAKSFEANHADADTLTYMDQISLLTDIDNLDSSSEKVTMMTLHSAKGLEFKVIFLAGMEEGLLPHSRNIEDPELLEEERRLCYVGMTRAKDNLFISNARTRRSHDGISTARPSRFLDDIPMAVLDERGSGRLKMQRKTPTFGSNIDNIGKFFKDKKIDVDFAKLNRHAKTRKEGDFRKGDKVFLGKYGKGTIMTTEGDGDDLRYVVYFPKIGQRKKLLAKIAKLKLV